MAGKFWQPSHEPPSPRETGICHTETVEKGRGETEVFLALKTAWQMLGLAYIARSSNTP